MNPYDRLRPSSDISAASWIATSVGAFGAGVGSLLPPGFEAYARILHPARADGTPVRWSQVAAWSGKVIHPLVQFDAAARPSSAAPRAAQPWNNPPDKGNMQTAILRSLCEILARHTATPSRCWFCLWDGYGWIKDSAPAPAHDRTSESFSSSKRQVVTDGLNDQTKATSPAFTEQVLHGPRLRLPKRSYFLLEGPLEAATELGWILAGSRFISQSPNLFWPDDHTWCVATEIDLDSSYVGGSEALVESMLSAPYLEIMRATPNDRIDLDSDEINR